MAEEGWLLDLYPGGPGEMVVWVKGDDGSARRFVDRWTPSMYVACRYPSDLAQLAGAQEVQRHVEGSAVVRRYERVIDLLRSDVLELRVKDARRLPLLATIIERSKPFGHFRLYNVDVPPAQSYLYQKDLFPLARAAVERSGDGRRLEWTLKDDVWDCDYAVPPLTSVGVEADVGKHGNLASEDDPLRSLTVRKGGDGGGEEVVLDGGDEGEKILSLVRTVRELDPDIIFTDGGDSFLLPYLAKRARARGVEFSLDRGPATRIELPSRPGTSYFSYGKILYKPSTVKLKGRVHIDVANSFVYGESGLEGFYELSRICRMPLHTSSRATIGRALSSLQFYNAYRQDLLVPWKPTLVETPKDRFELLVADRGGFTFEPRLGLHEDVAEYDFSSLYPNIMLKKNISGETVRCACCPESDNRVPELGWNVCRRRTGIVPRSMEIIVGKRLRYKRLRHDLTRTAEQRARYDARQVALKWVGVTCLPPESYVLIREGGHDRCTKIGDLIDSVAGDRTGIIECPEMFVSGIGPDLKSRFCRVDRLVKQANAKKLLRVEMEDGRRVVVTPDHPFFTLHDSELKVKAADELEVGELVPVAKRTPAPMGTCTIDLIEGMKGKLSAAQQSLWRVGGEAVKDAVGANKQRLLRAAKPDGYDAQAVRLWGKAGIIPIKFFHLLGIRPSQRAGLKIGSGRRKGGRIAWVPAVLKADETLGFFLGLYVADGSAGSNFIRLDIGSREPDLLDSAQRVVMELFGVASHVYRERGVQMFVVQINSATLVQVLERVFDLPGSAERGKLKVPEMLFDAEAEGAAHGFIEGMIAGDGYVSKKRHFVNIATKSDDLACQLGFLAARIGLTYRIARLRIRSFPLNTINFAGPETLRKIFSGRYLKEGHRETFESWLNRCGPSCSHSSYDRLPVEESGLYALAKETRTSSEPHARPGSEMCPVSAIEKLARIRARNLGERQIAQAEKLERLLKSDVGFVRVVSVTELDSRPKYVYCFQLDKDEIPGFFTGEGLVYVHNCFGYLGHANAKFGRIDAHIAVCAWDRAVLLQAVRVAESRGFRVMHGIVDSLWVKKEGAKSGEYLALRAEMERETGFDVSFEGLYKWIAFLPSKTDAAMPSANRYFGAYGEGGLKVRGIEARRHDTPVLFKRCQMEMLELLAGADGIEEARALVPECRKIVERYAAAILGHEVPLRDLVITRSLSKGPSEYRANTLEASAASQLTEAGRELHAGESVGYVITSQRSTSRRFRTKPQELISRETRYDADRYVELLEAACRTVLGPFE